MNHSRAPLSAINLAMVLGLALSGCISSSSVQAQDAPETPGAIHVSSPGCLYCPFPEFPKKAGKTKSAAVQLDVNISADGHATGIQVVQDPGSGFGEKAVEAVKKWKFKPARRPDGTPVAVRIKIEVVFKRF